MTNFKGTKGKWVFDDEEMKIKGSGDANGRTVIANVSPKMDYSRGMATQQANTLLISKAPDMLEMLEKVSNILNVDEFLHDTSIRQYFYHQIQEINDLIKESTKL